jgi:DNA-binding transcriptional LysR family regulator
MDLRHLNYFVTVAERGTVSAAAEHLHTTQPSISRQIRDLEGELGIDLFERFGRRLHLTGAGEDLLRNAREVLNQSEEFRERARSLREGNVGVLRVGATPQTLERLFPAALGRFEKKHAGVTVRLIEGNTSSLSERLRQGDLHLALTAYQAEWHATSHILGISPLIAIGKQGLRRSQRSIELSLLEDEPLLLLQKGFGSRDLFDAACRIEHLRQNIYLESGASRTLIALANAGHGIAVLPATVGPVPSKLPTHALTQEKKRLELPFAVHWSAQRFLPSYAREFVRELDTVARAQFRKAKEPWSIRPALKRRAGPAPA